MQLGMQLASLRVCLNALMTCMGPADQAPCCLPAFCLIPIYRLANNSLLPVFTKFVGRLFLQASKQYFIPECIAELALLIPALHASSLQCKMIEFRFSACTAAKCRQILAVATGLANCNVGV